MKRIIHAKEKDIIVLMSRIKHRMFPRAFERLGVKENIKREELIGVEIGVYKAEHALSLLKYLDIKTLYLVDPYVHNKAHEEGKRHHGVDQLPLCVAEMIARKRLKRFTDKIVFIRKLSSDCLDDIPNDLDFVYVDGNHHFRFFMADIENYFPKVRPGGIIGGHDFYNGFCREHDDVVRAVSEFAVRRNLPLQVELPDWWIIKKRQGGRQGV
ncbi:MAG: class I SAM-dependent methyltransferase [Minisyncoccia bacterium]